MWDRFASRFRTQGSLKAIKLRGVKVRRGQWREQGKGRSRLPGRFADVSRRDARAELDRIVAAVNNRETSRPTKVETLRQFTENEYLTQRTRQWKALTALTTEQLIDAHLLRQLGYRPLAQIMRRELQSHLDSLAGAGRSASIVRHFYFQLQAIFAMSKGDGLITVNLIDGLATSRCKGAPDKRVLDLSDSVKACMALPIRERLIFQLALFEGMRQGEIVGLQIGDLGGDEVMISRCSMLEKSTSRKPGGRVVQYR